ncbi:MAG: hydroxymethylbilane synthase [Desulfobacterales bacterium]
MGASIRIGTRGSKLALWQASWVATAIQSHTPSLSPELVIIKTKGDRIQDVPLAQIGGKALFITEIEEALLGKKIDFAVHSMKDMPAEIPEGLCIGAIPEREITADALVSRNGNRFSELGAGSRIGTGSLRRSALLRHARPDIEILPLRGNLDTRLRKLETEDMDAIVLAAAGIKRLGWQDRITEYLDEGTMLPAVGQGALCIETRREDRDAGSMIAHLDHQDTRTAVTGERAFLNRLEGSCHVPIAALGKVEKDQLVIDGLVADVDGKVVIRESHSGPVTDSEGIGIALADRLLAMGARDILAQLAAEGHGNER